MGTVDELGHAEEPKDESQERADTPAAHVPPVVPARHSDPTGVSHASEDFQPSVSNRARWVDPNRR